MLEIFSEVIKVAGDLIDILDKKPVFSTGFFTLTAAILAFFVAGWNSRRNSERQKELELKRKQEDVFLELLDAVTRLSHARHNILRAEINDFIEAVLAETDTKTEFERAWNRLLSRITLYCPPSLINDAFSVLSKGGQALVVVIEHMDSSKSEGPISDEEFETVKKTLKTLDEELLANETELINKMRGHLGFDPHELTRTYLKIDSAVLAHKRVERTRGNFEYSTPNESGSGGATESRKKSAPPATGADGDAAASRLACATCGGSYDGAQSSGFPAGEVPRQACRCRMPYRRSNFPASLQSCRSQTLAAPG